MWAGQDASGNVVNDGRKFIFTIKQSPFSAEVDVTGLQANTEYIVWIAVKDTALNDATTVYGSHVSTMPAEECGDSLGMNSFGIQDAQLGASTWLPGMLPKCARLNVAGIPGCIGDCWCVGCLNVVAAPPSRLA